MKNPFKDTKKNVTDDEKDWEELAQSLIDIQQIWQFKQCDSYGEARDFINETGADPRFIYPANGKVIIWYKQTINN